MVSYIHQVDSGRDIGTYRLPPQSPSFPNQPCLPDERRPQFPDLPRPTSQGCSENNGGRLLQLWVRVTLDSVATSQCVGLLCREISHRGRIDRECKFGPKKKRDGGWFCLHQTTGQGAEWGQRRLQGLLRMFATNKEDAPAYREDHQRRCNPESSQRRLRTQEHTSPGSREEIS